jgi:hypothetical protein
MNWTEAITRNTEALVAVLASLFEMLGGDWERGALRLSRTMHRSVLRVLRPAESAVRRLIILAAQGLVAKPAPVRQVCLRPGAIRPGQLEKTCSRRCRFIFQLHDPRKSFTPRRSGMVRRAVARISVLSFDPRIAAQWATSQPVVDLILADDGLISGQSVNRRLHFRIFHIKRKDSYAGKCGACTCATRPSGPFLSHHYVPDFHRVIDTSPLMRWKIYSSNVMALPELP